MSNFLTVQPNLFNDVMTQISAIIWTNLVVIPWKTRCDPQNRENSRKFQQRFHASFQDGQAALSDRRLWAAVRGGAGILGPRLQPGGTVLLDDVHAGEFDYGGLHEGSNIWIYFYRLFAKPNK